jgi:hypothetical protein
MSAYTLLSIQTKSHTIAYQFAPSDKPVGTVYTTQHALISNGSTVRDYEVSEHEGCPNGGFKFSTMEQWSDDTHCTGCELYEYHSIGD